MNKLLDIKNLHVSFHTHGGTVQAVRGVNFSLYNGETIAIVGESGSGKSVTVKAIMRLLQNHSDELIRGEVMCDGENLLKLSEKDMNKVRGKEISMIFQDPMTSLNPTMKIGIQIAEGIMEHQGLGKMESLKRAQELMVMVGIDNPQLRMKQYPHQLSGGMRQRVVIATALACNPKVLIADEPTTALDVTIQAQILELMKALQEKINTSIIFITHDLGVVANVADRVAVMYAGQIVEIGTVDEIFYDPRHPYTWGLLSSMPSLDVSQKTELVAIPGTPPDLINPPKGCAFAARNPNALAIEFEEEPPYFQVSETHFAKTWLLHEDAPKIEPPAVVKSRLRLMKGNFDKPIQVEVLK